MYCEKVHALDSKTVVSGAAVNEVGQRIEGTKAQTYSSKCTFVTFAQEIKAGINRCINPLPLYTISASYFPSKMEAALAQLGATFLRYAIENPQFRNGTDPSLYTLLESLSLGRSTSMSVEESGDVIDHQVKASRASEAPVTSSMIPASKPDTEAYISRTLVNRNFTFTESDLFRKDQITSLRDQYLRWRHNCTEEDDLNSVLDQIVAAANRLSTLKDDEIGSIPLEMTYFYLFSQYRQYKLSNDGVYLTKSGLYDTILHRLHGDEWDNLNDGVRQCHRDKLHRQLFIGRRWSVAVDRLSPGVIILAGKKLSSLV